MPLSYKEGYVTRFEVRKVFMDQFPIQKVGGDIHAEWWVPAEQLEALNDNIGGKIRVVAHYSADA